MNSVVGVDETIITSGVNISLYTPWGQHHGDDKFNKLDPYIPKTSIHYVVPHV